MLAAALGYLSGGFDVAAPPHTQEIVRQAEEPLSPVAVSAPAANAVVAPPVTKLSIGPPPSACHQVKVKMTGGLESSLDRVLKHSEASELSMLLERVFRWDLDLGSEIRRGDELNMLYEYSQELDSLKIHAIQYSSQLLKQKLMYLRFQKPGERYERFTPATVGR